MARAKFGENNLSLIIYMFHSKKQLIDKPIEVKELPGEKPKHKKKKTNKDFFDMKMNPKK